jgi:hypothetical protein
LGVFRERGICGVVSAITLNNSKNPNQVFFFAYHEAWTVWEAFYFVWATVSTCGFGDYYPSDNRSKVVLYFFAMTCLSCMACFFSLLEDHFESFVSTQPAMPRAELYCNGLYRTVRKSFLLELIRCGSPLMFVTTQV